MTLWDTRQVGEGVPQRDGEPEHDEHGGYRGERHQVLEGADDAQGHEGDRQQEDAQTDIEIYVGVLIYNLKIQPQ